MESLKTKSKALIKDYSIEGTRAGLMVEVELPPTVAESLRARCRPGQSLEACCLELVELVVCSKSVVGNRNISIVRFQ